MISSRLWQDCNASKICRRTFQLTARNQSLILHRRQGSGNTHELLFQALLSALAHVDHSSGISLGAELDYDVDLLLLAHNDGVVVLDDMLVLDISQDVDLGYHHPSLFLIHSGIVQLLPHHDPPICYSPHFADNSESSIGDAFNHIVTARERFRSEFGDPQGE